jgi:hypothetical protein
MDSKLEGEADHSLSCNAKTKNAGNCTFLKYPWSLHQFVTFSHKQLQFNARVICTF